MAPSPAIVEGPALLRITVNGEERTGIAEPRTLLVDFLRHELGLTGTHVGCEQGLCGACSVSLDGQLVRSCLIFAHQAEGRDVRTIEGFSSGEALHPIQQAFHDKHGLQCGFCTPGLILATADLLAQNANPTEEEIRVHLSGNICRCTGYVGVVASVLEAAARTAQSTTGS